MDKTEDILKEGLPSDEDVKSFTDSHRKTLISYDIKKAPMKEIRIRNNQVQSVRIVYKETQTTIEIDIYPRVNMEDNGRPKGDMLGPGQTLEITE